MSKKAGAPTKYRERYCEDVIDHMAGGLSFETFAAVINVNVDTLYEWAKVHPKFSEAKKNAFVKCQLFWEQMGIEGTQGQIKEFNSTSYIYNMKNRFRRSKTWEPIKEEFQKPEMNIKLSYDPKEP